MRQVHDLSEYSEGKTEGKKEVMAGEEWGNENRRKVAKKERFKEVKKERDGGTALEVKEQKKEE